MNKLPVFLKPYSRKKSRFKMRKILTFGVAILIGLSPVLKSFAQETSPFYWDFINVEIDVQKNGDMLVSEAHKYVFFQSHTNKRFRYIPLDNVDKITDVTVWENQKQIPSETGIRKRKIWIKWQHKLKASESHTFVLKYRVIGGLHIDKHGDKVKWTAIFPNRNAVVKNAKIVVRFPEVLSQKIKAYESLGVPTNAKKINSTTVEFVALKSIPPQQKIEVIVQFPHNIINVSTLKLHKGFFMISILMFLFWLAFLYIIFASDNFFDGNGGGYGGGGYGGGGYGGGGYGGGGGCGGGGGGCGGGGGGCGGGGGG